MLNRYSFDEVSTKTKPWKWNCEKTTPEHKFKFFRQGELELVLKGSEGSWFLLCVLCRKARILCLDSLESIVA
jgi:hypothetical protein